jgi:phage FluMu protein Com
MTTQADREAHDEARCSCGRLLARLTEAGIELKCSRCRRVVVIEWSAVRDDRAAGP